MAVKWLAWLSELDMYITFFFLDGSHQHDARPPLDRCEGR